jgi:hypothetical protein
MTLPALQGGLLPLGRHPCTLVEAQSEWVSSPQYAASSTRRPIWDDLELGLSVLRAVVRVHALWIGGSFTTDKLDPGDIDVVFLVNAGDRYALAAPERRVVDSFVTNVAHPVTGKPVRQHLLSIDSFVVDWAPHNGNPRALPDYGKYVFDRGYWDDFWLRRRSGSKTDPLIDEDAHPARGYVEVSLDAYS